jgi:hypothetical protein
MRSRLGTASPQLVVLTATAISAVNVLIALGLVHLATVHLAVVNIALASVLGVVARGLVPAEPPAPTPAPCRVHQPEGGSIT